LDRVAASPGQANTLLGLVHKARNTVFGVAHDFRRIRAEEDFRRLVPVTTTAVLARTYWQPNVTALNGTTWPEPVAGLAAYDTGEKPPRQVLLSPDLFRCQRAAIRTALAFVLRAQPAAQLLSGTLLFLDGPISVTALNNRPSPPSPEATVLRGVPLPYQPYCLAHSDATPDALTEKVSAMPLTLVCGPLTDITRLFDRVRLLANRDRITDIWPGLTAVLYSCGPAQHDRVHELRQEMGPKVTLMEMARFPEGLVAVEDPRFGLLRLLADYGVYCEFIAVEECGKRAPERVGLSQVRAGAIYELALTSPAGVWSCRAGAAVCFERIDPPLFRLVEMPRLEPASEIPGLTTITRQDAADEFKASAPHRRSAGIPAAPPKSFGHNPWLIPVDRG
jgi:hypothetical protein